MNLKNLLKILRTRIANISKEVDIFIYYRKAILLNILNKKMIEYIWYCPRSSCNSIITKTNEPILRRGEVFVCKRCKCQFSGDELIFHNKKNIKKYLDDVGSCLKC